ncbi:hypothetical protein ABXT21_25215 [Ralstonia sp. SM1864_UCD524_TZ4]|uniref:hypothetical protein n=1 Tax=Ralstonia pseudosolanacearum TaxID=1310165 RepID=UPI0018D05880|nr:hypothetical protein [Ralstonia pseudosolanacearum]
MAEHFNIAVVLGLPKSSDGRLDIILSLREIYSPLFGDIQEVCLNNYKTAASVCERWPEGEALLKAGAGNDELLFVYGERSGASVGSRSSLHVEESNSCNLFLISLPLSPDTSLLQLESYLLRTRDFSEQLSGSFVVAAGWEFECDISEKIESILLGCLSDDSLCLWLAAPKRLISNLPKMYSKVGESDQTMLLRRV